MHGRFYKIVLVALAILLLAGSGFVQRQLNRQRADPLVGLTRIDPLENAPPMLAFTTVALGGFRGLIANALWIRANDLQNEGKYFEMVQLADWITKLEPTFAQVWVVQAWNMAYNISVKFPDPTDRWRWVQRGIELLRDEGLRYNPREALIYRELAWFFQHKMGQNLDDAHLQYKYNWAVAMTNLFGGARPDFDQLLNPATPETRQRARQLRERYRMDPALMREADRLYGPLEWRLPEAHAIYWAHVGLTHAKKKDLITLRRVIYQSMQMSVLRGRLIALDPLWFGPDLDKAAAANTAYEQMIVEETELKHPVKVAHKNFLRQLVYLCYTHGRTAEANQWFAQLKEKYPDAVSPGQTMEQFSLERIQGNLSLASHDQTKAFLEGLLTRYWLNLGADEDAHADALYRMATHFWNTYMEGAQRRGNVLALPALDQMSRKVLDDLLAAQTLGPEFKARLRTRAGLPAPSPPAANTASGAPGP